MSQWTQVFEPIPGLPDTALHFLKFRTYRVPDYLTQVNMIAIYQMGEMHVSVLLRGDEPKYTLVRLLELAHDIPLNFVYSTRKRASVSIRETVWSMTYPDKIDCAAYVLGRCKPCQKKN